MTEAAFQEATIGDLQSDPPLTGLGFAALPLILWFMDDSADGIASALVAICILLIALRFLARGHVYALRYARTPDARAPRIPFKLLGSLCLGGLVTLLSGGHFESPVPPVLLGMTATALSVLAFGIDPFRDKGTRPLAPPASEAGPEQAPGSEQPDDREIFDIAFDGIIADVKQLEDARLCQQLETLRDLLLGRLDAVADKSDAFEHMAARARKILLLLTEETERLIADQSGPRADFARQRYAAKVDVLTRKVAGATHDPARVGRRGPLDQRADMLFARMRRESSG
ncbi:hypothetical protein [Allosediminivita pacifica]|uniref:5-bromo-4-chloroindolyl phosphate hydrolysis protein n=1 Tax=Allosediminivita pacifica TaxID=1267769 RepID=A0A2T6AXD4_9RHOB|nr:hypothetical protein [Allosediminivita pacifica]PTX48461.1 hypothetical protein C8N44_109154 [Allosediminivita pacifica]GGB10342.1 hypothetical protein GCM10011324_20470 [Allosediminivita pacifica]